MKWMCSAKLLYIFCGCSCALNFFSDYSVLDGVLDGDERNWARKKIKLYAKQFGKILR
jgi:hypothetical protein